ncbi:MAG: hypothetical protein ACREP9_09890, partial [Candidatus Dormibacteraceae bacterium]
MSAMREELHHLVDRIPPGDVPPVLDFVRDRLSPRYEKALEVMAAVNERTRDMPVEMDDGIDRIREE